MVKNGSWIKTGSVIFSLIIAFVVLVMLLFAQLFHFGSAYGKIHVGMSHAQVRHATRQFRERPVPTPSSVYPAAHAHGITTYTYDLPFDASDSEIWVAYDAHGRVIRVWETD